MAKTRKTYTAEFKLQAVRMVTDQHRAVAAVARRLGITEGRLREWLKAFRAQVRTPARPDPPLTPCPLFVGKPGFSSSVITAR